MEGMMLSEIRQRKTNTVWYHLYVESKKQNKLVNKQKGERLTDIENKLVVTSVEVQTTMYEINKQQEYIVQHRGYSQ